MPAFVRARVREIREREHMYCSIEMLTCGVCAVNNTQYNTV